MSEGVDDIIHALENRIRNRSLESLGDSPCFKVDKRGNNLVLQAMKPSGLCLNHGSVTY